MVKQIKWRKQAVEQLEGIYQYIEKDSVLQAQKIKSLILRKIGELPKNPTLYSPDQFKTNNQQSKYRAFTVFKFRISYFINKDEIIIVRIRHTSMSPEEY